MKEHTDAFMYLDPPYANGAHLYGTKGDMHEGFDHKGLADEIKKRDGWVLSYNDCETVRICIKGTV